MECPEILCSVESNAGVDSPGQTTVVWFSSDRLLSHSHVQDQRAVLPHLTASVAGLVPKEAFKKSLDALKEVRQQRLNLYILYCTCMQSMHIDAYASPFCDYHNAQCHRFKLHGASSYKACVSQYIKGMCESSTLGWVLALTSLTF